MSDVLKTIICQICGVDVSCKFMSRKRFCLECRKERTKVLQREGQKRKRAKPEFKEKYRAYSIQRNYGITMDEFNALLALQGGVCAICKGNNSENKREWAVDHCHKTNQVRGILCNKCNMMIGLGKDNMLTFHRAISYIGRCGYAAPF